MCQLLFTGIVSQCNLMGLAYLHDIEGLNKFKKLQFQFNYSIEWSLVHNKYVGGLLFHKRMYASTAVNNNSTSIPQAYVNQA